MAYGEILMGEDGSIRTLLDGEPYDVHETRRREHMAREEWGHESSYDHGERVIRSGNEWGELADFDYWIEPLGNDVIVYRKMLSITGEVDDVDRFYYACGRTKARIESEFNEMVAPTIMRDAPQTLPRRGGLHTYGLMDPRFDDFVWPENIKLVTPPCIEIRRTYAKTMPIDAFIPPIGQRGKVMFECTMRYGPDGDLARADCRIMRREDWLVRVRVDRNGDGKVVSAKNI